jgi:hypothetical protein
MTVAFVKWFVKDLSAVYVFSVEPFLVVYPFLVAIALGEGEYFGVGFDFLSSSSSSSSWASGTASETDGESLGNQQDNTKV